VYKPKPLCLWVILTDRRGPGNTLGLVPVVLAGLVIIWIVLGSRLGPHKVCVVKDLLRVSHGLAVFTAAIVLSEASIS